MSIAKEVRGLFTSNADTEEEPTLEEIRERRRKLTARIEELEAKVQWAESPRGRAELLEECASPEELGRRRRKLRDELEGLKEKDRQEAARQRELEQAERAGDYTMGVGELPAMADNVEEAEAVYREAMEELREKLTSLEHDRVRLERSGEAPGVFLSDEAMDGLEELVERMNLNVDVSRLRRPEKVEGRPLLVYDVSADVRRWVGDWSKAPRRAGTPRHAREAGWREDFSEAEGVPAGHRRRRVVSRGID